MTRAADRKKSGGRVTPKGGASRAGGPAHPDASRRYTPPVPREQKVSPRWVPVLMWALMGLGALVIFANYSNLVPGETNNLWLWIGLALILAGIMTATQYH